MHDPAPKVAAPAQRKPRLLDLFAGAGGAAAGYARAGFEVTGFSQARANQPAVPTGKPPVPQA
jgi:hypothetical protein